MPTRMAQAEAAAAKLRLSARAGSSMGGPGTGVWPATVESRLANITHNVLPKVPMTSLNHTPLQQKDRPAGSPGTVTAFTTPLTTTAAPPPVCGVVKFDGDITFMPADASKYIRRGTMQTWNGRGTMTWKQALMSFHYDEVFFEVEDKLFAKVRVSTDADLARFDWNTKGKIDTKGKTILAVINCEDMLSYVLLENSTAPYAMEIYDNRSTLLARSKPDPLAEQLAFELNDTNKTLLAFAESPVMGTNTLKADEAKPDPSKGGVRRWELQVNVGGQPPNSTFGFLFAMENQWVVAMAAQMFAVREAQRGKGYGGIAEPPMVVSLLVWLTATLVALAIAGAVYGLFRVYSLVYPVVYIKEENPFLRSTPLGSATPGIPGLTLPVPRVTRDATP